MKVNCNDEGIRKSVEIIENGGVIIFPTDTVYGIGCNPYDANAVKKIYEIKSREKIKSLPVLASSIEIVKQISIIDEFTEKIIKKYWPGPLTLILKLKGSKVNFIFLKSYPLLTINSSYISLASTRSFFII